MSYATKYRPRSLAGVIGNAEAIGVLRGALKKDRVPQAILLAGPSGCGKTTIARALYNHLVCERGQACGKCEACKRDDRSDLTSTNGAKERGIDEMRALIDQSKYRPQYARKRVVIIDEVHQTTPQAQEALLIPLEDPPKDTIFILCTTEPDKLKVAMRNRCQVLTVKHPDEEETTQYLRGILEQESIELDSDDVFKSIYEQAGSSLRESVQLLESLVNFIQGKKAEPSEDELLKFLTTSGASSGNATSIQIIKAIYVGDYPSVHKALLNCEDYNALVNSLIWLNSFLVDVYVTKGAKNKNIWWTPANKEIHKWFKELTERPTLEQTIITQTGLVELKFQLGYAGLSDRHLIGAKMYRLMKETGLM